MSVSTPLRRLLATFATLLLTASVSAAEFNVTRADDPPPDGCLPTDCSLREAVAAALATPEADVVRLQAGQYQLSTSALVVSGQVTITGTGSDQTRLVGNIPGTLVLVDTFADVTLQGIEMVNADDEAVMVAGASSLLLRDITVPDGGGGVDTGAAADTSLDLRIEQSRFGSDNRVICRQSQGRCRVVDSELGTGIGVVSEAVVVEVIGSILGPESAGANQYGIVTVGTAPLTVRDSLVRHSLRPLDLMHAGNVTAAPVTITRTRFISNYGPIRGDRVGVVSMNDIEIRDHVTANSAGFSTLPAALLVEAGPLWSIHRALIIGNRGGGTDGATVRVLAGGRLGITNSTLYDNTFRADVANGYGHTIGVYNGSGDPTSVALMHNTLRRAPDLAANAPGSLLTVRGGATQVLVVNSLFRGTCAFGGGGSITNATGNIESPGTTCQMPSGSNQQVAELQLRMGPLTDNGGFTDSFLPAPGSALLDAANGAGCQLAQVDQRGFQRPADGVGCDVGAIERGAVLDLIFADGFQGH